MAPVSKATNHQLESIAVHQLPGCCDSGKKLLRFADLLLRLFLCQNRIGVPGIDAPLFNAEW